MTSLLAALSSFLTGNAVDDLLDDVPPGHLKSNPAPASTIDDFNDHIAALHLALVERRVSDAIQLRTDICELLHNVPAADPRAEMAADVSRRVVAAVVATFASPTLSVEDALSMWQESLLYMWGTDPAGAIHGAFLQALYTAARNTALESCRRMDTVRSLMSLKIDTSPSINLDVGTKASFSLPAPRAVLDPAGAASTGAAAIHVASAMQTADPAKTFSSGFAAAARFLFAADDSPHKPVQSPPPMAAGYPLSQDLASIAPRKVSAPHPFLFRHHRAIHLALRGRRSGNGGQPQHVSAQAHEDAAWAAVSAVADAASDDDGVDVDADTGAGGSAMQPHVEALNTIFSDAASLMTMVHKSGGVGFHAACNSSADGIMSGPPVAVALSAVHAREEALRLLHNVCSRAALMVLQAYHADTLLLGTLAVAQEALHAALDSDGALFDVIRCAASIPAGLANPAGINQATKSMNSQSEVPGAACNVITVQLPVPSPFSPIASALDASLCVEWSRHTPVPPPGSRTTLPQAASEASQPCVLPIDIALSIADESADQVSFISQLFERYIKCSSFHLAECALEREYLEVFQARALGSAPDRGAPPRGGGHTPGPVSTLGERDPLCLAMWALQGQYVQLERAYLLASVRLALRPPAGWRGVSVHEDTRVRTYAWCDHVFFLLSKTVSRACASGADMAAAAVANYAAGACDGIIRSVLLLCVRACCLVRSASDPRTRPSFLWRSLLDAVAAARKRGGVHQGPDAGGLLSALATSLKASSDDDDMDSSVSLLAVTPTVSSADGAVAAASDEFDAEIAASFSAAMSGAEGPHLAAATTPIKSNRGAAGTPESFSPDGVHFHEDEGDADAAGTGSASQRWARWPVASDTAVLCLNTVATAAVYAASLYDRTAAEFAVVFPPPLDSLSGEARGGVATTTGANSLASQLSLSPTTAAAVARLATLLPPPALPLPPPTASMLRAPLTQLREAAGALAELPTAAAAVLSCVLGAAGLCVVRRLLRGSAGHGTGAISGGGSIGGGGFSYVLASGAKEFDATSGSRDPLVAAVRGPLCAVGAALHVTLPQLLKPRMADALVVGVAAAVADELGTAWASARVDEYGALLMGAQLRRIYGALSGLARAGAGQAALRGLLATGRLHQLVQVLGVESLSDLAGLAFPVPALTRAEVAALVSNRVGFLHQGGGAAESAAAAAAVLDTVAWDLVPVVDAPG